MMLKSGEGIKFVFFSKFRTQKPKKYVLMKAQLKKKKTEVKSECETSSHPHQKIKLFPNWEIFFYWKEKIMQVQWKKKKEKGSQGRD